MNVLLRRLLPALALAGVVWAIASSFSRSTSPNMDWSPGSAAWSASSPSLVST